jgi:hypothetical protein
MARKAQSMIFEQVLLFGMGIIIFVICFGVFNAYQDYFVSVSLNDQLNEIKSWVGANILKLTEKDLNTDAYVILEMPRRIGGEEYVIELGDEGLNVTSLVTNTVKRSNLFNLTSTYSLSGKAESAGRRFIIYKRGDKIIIS